MSEQELISATTPSKTERVRHWMQTFGQETPASPCLPSIEIRQLRHALIKEEWMELYESESEVDALDAFADLRYVILGAFVAYGFPCEHPGLPLPTVHSLMLMNDCLLGAADTNTAFTWLRRFMQWMAFAEFESDFTQLQLSAAFDEVHRSNMSKAWTYEEVKLGIPEGCTANAFNPDSDRPYVVKNAAGKVIKSPSYSPANLALIVEGTL